MTLTVERLAIAKGFAEQELGTFGLRDASGGVEIPYYNTDGSEYSRTRIRTDAIAKVGSRWGAGSDPLIPYGLHHPVVIETYAFIVEGESDCWALWTAALPALGIPGASNARCLRVEYIGAADKVYVVQEPGDAGTRFPHQVALALYDSGFAGAAYAITMPAPFKDPQEAFAADRGAFKDAMREAVRDATAVPRVAPAVKITDVDRDPAEGMSFDDLAVLSSVKLDWLIEGVLPRSGLLMIASAPKVGKSELARNLARGVATGTPFLGRRCQQGVVVWIGLEESPGHLLERAEVMGLNALHIVYFTQKNQPAETSWLRAIIIRHRPALVIIDTIGRFSTIEDINNYSQVMRATQPMLDMRTEFGTTFAFLHHNNKNNTVLGSTMWSGVVDTIMSLSRNDDGQRFVKTTQRSGVDMEPAALQMDHDTGTITVSEDKWLADQRVAEQRILNYLADGKRVSRQEASQHSGRRGVIGRAALDALVSAGMVETSGSGAKGDPRLFRARPGENASDKYIQVLRDKESDGPTQPDLPRTNGLSDPGLGMSDPVRPRTINSEESDHSDHSEQFRTIPSFPNNPEEPGEAQLDGIPELSPRGMVCSNCGAVGRCFVNGTVRTCEACTAKADAA